MFNRIRSWFGGGGLTVSEGTQTPAPKVRAVSTPVTVDFDSAMQLSAVWACATLITEAVSSLPLEFYIQGKDSKVLADKHPLDALFTGRVNPRQTRIEFFQTFVLNLCMHGNAYAKKETIGGRIVSLMPLSSSQMETRLVSGRVVHYHHEGGNVHVYDDSSIWHVKLAGNGVIGLSPIQYGAGTMGSAIAAERRAAEIFANGGKPTGILTYDRVLSDEQRKHIKQEFKELKEGNTDELMVLEADFKYQQVSMSPQDIELLRTRNFNIEDICRWFGVPSVLVNHNNDTSVWGSGIEQIIQAFYKLKLRNYLELIEASIAANLDTEKYKDGEKLCPAFDFDALTRASTSERFEALQKAVQTGLITINEGRKKEGYDPIAGGDVLLVNGNMIPVSQAGRFANET